MWIFGHFKGKNEGYREMITKAPCKLASAIGSFGVTGIFTICFHQGLIIINY
jgi:hypothetical protein